MIILHSELIAEKTDRNLWEPKTYVETVSTGKDSKTKATYGGVAIARSGGLQKQKMPSHRDIRGG
jgi:hypothetical protein